MSVEVRSAIPADVGMLLASPDLFDEAPTAAGLTAFLNAANHLLVIAVKGNVCIGFASAMHHLRPDQPAEMYIDDLGVSETFRRQGVATRLLAYLSEQARACNCSALWVLADATPEALGLYTDLGWQREGDHVAMFTQVLK